MTVMRTARRLPRGVSPTPRAEPEARLGDVALVLEERRRVHAGAGVSPVADAPAQLLGVRAFALRCGARCTLHRIEAPTNVARNYYDDGRDLDVTDTLVVVFDAADDALLLLSDERSPLPRWLQRRAVHGARLRVGAAEVALRDERDLALATELLDRLVAAMRSARVVG